MPDYINELQNERTNYDLQRKDYFYKQFNEVLLTFVICFW